VLRLPGTAFFAGLPSLVLRLRLVLLRPSLLMLRLYLVLLRPALLLL